MASSVSFAPSQAPTSPQSPKRVSSASPPPPSQPLPQTSPQASPSPSQPSEQLPLDALSPPPVTPSPSGARKRAASSEPPDSPRQKYKKLRVRKAKHEAAGTSPAQKGETLVWLRAKLNDIIEGRTGTEQLKDWEESWHDLCDLLDERDELAKKEKQLLKEIGTLTAHCERLEARIGMRH